MFIYNDFLVAKLCADFIIVFTNYPLVYITISIHLKNKNKNAQSVLCENIAQSFQVGT
jgi:hypothetical protein